MPKAIFGLGTSSAPAGSRFQRRGQKSEVRRRSQQSFGAIAVLSVLFCLLSCSSKPDPYTLVMIIESSPTNLDPRVGIDGQSENIDNLIFDDLLTKGDDLNVAPGLAERWEIPDPRT